MSFRDRFGHKEPLPPRTEREDAPPAVRKLLLDLMEERVQWDEEFDPYEMVCDALDEVPREEWPQERRDATRRAVNFTLDWPDVYDLIGRVASRDQEERINRVLAKAGIGFEYYGGEFQLFEPEADELEVTNVEEEPLDHGLDPKGRFRAPKEQYQKALDFLRSKPPDLPNAVASALNALEGTVGVITGKKNISDGLKQLYTGERTGLAKSMEMLFVYSSAMDGVRHGARQGSDISEYEATYVVRTAGSAIAYLIAAKYEGLSRS
jgi:hypothetical protein